jgi:hypothetical protein
VKLSRKAISACVSILFALTAVAHAQQPTPQKIVGQPLGPIIGGVTYRRPNTPIPDPESAVTVADWPTAMATGTVRDSKGDGVAGIPILLIQEEAGQVRRLHTDSKGKYYFQDLPPGTYHLFIGEREDTRFFQKKLAGGMHWEADISSQGQTVTTSPDSETAPEDESPRPPLTITHSRIAVILEAELPVTTATDQETNNGRETIPLRVVEVIQGSFPSTYLDITHIQRSQSGEHPRPGKQYLFLLSTYKPNKTEEVYFPNGMIPRDENPERFDRLVNWCRQFNSAAQAEHASPDHLIELLVSGIEDPAVEGMAGGILNELLSDVEQDRNNHSTEPDLPEVTTGSYIPMRESMKRLIRWGSRRPSMFTDFQRDRIFSVLRQIPSSQSIPSDLRNLVRSFSNKEYSQFLLGRVESVEGLPTADNLKDIQELAKIIRCHDLNRLTFLLDEIRNRINWNPKSEEAHSVKLALFRACRLVARDSMQKIQG